MGPPPWLHRGPCDLSKTLPPRRAALMFLLPNHMNRITHWQRTVLLFLCPPGAVQNGTTLEMASRTFPTGCRTWSHGQSRRRLLALRQTSLRC